MCVTCKDDFVYSTNVKFECRPQCAANFTRVQYGTGLADNILTTLRNLTDPENAFSLYSTERNTEEQGDNPQPLAAYQMNAFAGKVFLLQSRSPSLNDNQSWSKIIKSVLNTIHRIFWAINIPAKLWTVAGFNPDNDRPLDDGIHTYCRLCDPTCNFGCKGIYKISRFIHIFVFYHRPNESWLYINWDCCWSTRYGLHKYHLHWIKWKSRVPRKMSRWIVFPSRSNGGNKYV